MAKMKKLAGIKKSMPAVHKPGKPSGSSLLTNKNKHKKPKVY